MVSSPLPRRKSPVVLELDLTEAMVESVPADPLARVLNRRRAVLRDVVDGLHRAAGDPSVAALVAKVDGTSVPLARAQELRQAVAAFRRSGRRAVAWAESFGEFGSGTAGYYLASAFDEIVLQPSGDVGLTGIELQATFVRDALGKVGVTPQFAARHEYKNAANIFTEQGFTQAHREASERLVASTMEQVVEGIAESRRLSTEEVRAIVDRAPLTAPEALDAGLVDRLGYRDEVYTHLRRLAGEDASLTYVARYHKSRPPAHRARQALQRTAPGIALIHAAGAIRVGHGGRGPTGQSVGADSITAALRAALDDEHTRAIVLRVDSPGGSYVASDAIWRVTGKAREAGKPLVVSMGRLAGSGGYFISMAADRIIAQPATLTGSIGVVAGKTVVTDLLDRLGVGHDAATEGAHARLHSPRAEWSDADWERVHGWLDRVYEDFTAKVARCRSMSRPAVHEVARGRVWTGADAAANGLVDDLGGLDLALSEARDRARIRSDAPVRVFPRLTPLDRLRPAESSEDPAAAAVSSWAAGWGVLADAARGLGLPATGPLTMPGVELTG